MTGATITLMNRDDAYLRKREFRGPILDLADNDPIIHRIIDLYATGQIITKDEALSQMVVQLAACKEQFQRRAMDAAMMASRPSIIMCRPKHDS